MAAKKHADARNDEAFSEGGGAAVVGGGVGVGGGRVAATVLAAVLVGCACIFGVMAGVGAGAGADAGAAAGDGRSHGTPLFKGARLGLGDPGWGRAMTPKEQYWKNKIEREAAETTVKAVEALTGEFVPLRNDDTSSLGVADDVSDAPADADDAVTPPPEDGEDPSALGGVGGDGGDGDGNLNITDVAAKLGRWGACPAAFLTPNAGPRADWNPSYVATLALADHLYVLCVNDCGSIVIPEPLAQKTTLVDGGIFDVCDRADAYGLDHYKRASLSHAAAVGDAIAHGFDKVAVVEEDSASPGATGAAAFGAAGEQLASLTDEDLGVFEAALRGSDWSFFRLGWRQYTLEITPSGECPTPCACQKRGGKLCYVASAGCDLRSSDSYIVSRRYMKWMLSQLVGGGTVDYEVLPAAPGSLLAFPILSVQQRLDIPPEHQSAVSDLFVRKCLFEA